MNRSAARLAAGLAAATLVLPLAGAAQAAASTLAQPAAGSGVHFLSLPAGYDATSDGYSLYNVTTGTGAQAYWQAGFTGKGVGVALIDTGVSPVEGLTTGQNLVYGPDLSVEAPSTNLANYDSFGHGTHMAGIIAGRDTTATSPVGDSSDFVGMAPDAHVVSVKVADAYGDTDVSQLIAAIDWVVQHKDDPSMNIRVLNLSVGIDPTQPFLVDPLAYAVEQAWAHGIVVVAAAGNDGTTTGKKGPRNGSGLQDPAYDPTILAVGAADTKGTTDAHDDTVAAFSSTQGSGRTDDRKPDLVAPGMHVASLRDAGSFIDSQFSSIGAVNDRLMRGSGTSQAAAVVSGAAALVISQHPDATPDQVKNLLMHATSHLDKADPGSQGNGEIDLSKALDKKLDHWTQPRSRATGTGSLQADRPDGGLVDASGSQLSGEQDIFGNSVDTSALALAETSATAWTAGSFNGGTWTASDPTTDPTLGHTWSGHTWSSGDWAGHTWSSSDWTGHTWSGHTWSGNTWSGHTWSASGWSSNDWSSGVWQ